MPITRQDRLQQLAEIRNPEQRMARILADRTIAKAILKLGTLVGSDGKDGITPVKGKDYFTQAEINSVRDYIKSQVVKNGRDGIDGRSIKGDSGKDGVDGKDGYSPVRGIDYWTEEDKVKILAYIDKITPKAPSVDSVVAKVKGSLEAKDIKGLPDLKDLPSLIAYLKMGGFRGGGGSSTGGSGTVSSVSVTTANGVSGTVDTATTTPAITIVLGAIIPSSVAATGTVTGSNLSGTNTGDETATTIKTALGITTLSGSNTGDQTTTAGLSNTTDKNLVTDAQLTIIGNTSGINTGDQTSLPISASPTTQTAQGIIVSMTYGESITLGDLLYFKSDSKVYKADATSIATAKLPCIGLALATASSGANNVLLVGIYKDSTKWTGGTILTIGGMCYMSATAGGTTQTQPASVNNIIQVVGVAIATDTIYFNPTLTYITHT